MSISQSVAQHLPFLRRYGRALTGSQHSGDAYVAAALEAVVEDPGILKGADSPRVALYKLFTKIWNSVELNEGTDPSPGAKLPVEQRLGQITAQPRQAFLLVALEGFSEEDAAQVLVHDVVHAIDRARPPRLHHRRATGAEAGDHLVRDLARRSAAVASMHLSPFHSIGL